MPINYRDILIKAFRISWHYKFLWFFGLFTAVIAGSALQLFSGERQWLVDWERLEATGVLRLSALPNIMEAAAADPVGFAARLAVLLGLALLAAFLVWLGIVSQGGLLWGAGRLSRGKSLTFGEVIIAGRERLWPILFLHLLQRLLLWGMVASMGATVAFSIVKETLVIDLAATVILLLLLALAFIVVITVRYALLYVAIEDQPFGAALQSAVELWRRKPVLTIEAGLLMFAVQVVAGFLLTLSFFALLIPWIFSLYTLSQWSVSGGVVALLVTGIILFVFLAAWGGAVVTVFREALWAVFFTDVQETDAHSLAASLWNGRKPAIRRTAKK